MPLAWQDEVAGSAHSLHLRNDEKFRFLAPPQLYGSEAPGRRPEKPCSGQTPLWSLHREHSTQWLTTVLRVIPVLAGRACRDLCGGETAV